ncbi:MAG: ribosome recycling factor [Puniceicoccales bacterium]|jgi:ribosome recycling factor|nr:ribosome recycling factor [Puniceicoccales bacterium]
MDTNAEIKKAKAAMDAAVKHTLGEFNTLHSGKASAGMVENLPVEVYGNTSKLREIAAITTPDVKTIQIQPWDKESVKAVEKAILAANLGVTPIVTGMIVRCVIPEMSGERRQELSKVANGMAEDGRIKVRAIRRDIIELFKKAKKDGAIGEDDLKHLEKEVQALTDSAIKEIDDSLHMKSSDLMKV